MPISVSVLLSIQEQGMHLLEVPTTATAKAGLKSALLLHLRHRGALGGEAGEVFVRLGDGICQVRRVLKAGEEGEGDLRARYAFLPVTRRNIARPEPDRFIAVLTFEPQEDHGMAVLGNADLMVPEDLHEVAWFGGIEIREVFAEAHFVKEPGGSGTIGVPAAPDASPVGLSPNRQVRKDRIVEFEIPSLPEFLKDLQENQVSGSGAVAWGSRFRGDGELPLFKMGGGLKPEGCQMGGRVTPPMRHSLDLLQDEFVEAVPG